MLNIIYGIFIFIIGLMLGSFFNVCIYRIPRGESIVYPPSHCTNCGKKLKYIDLVPVLSYIFLKGRCRYCNEKISIRYAAVELFTAILFLSIYLKYGFTIESIKYIILSSFLIIIGMIDYYTMDVYSIITYTGIIVGIIFILIEYLTKSQIYTYLYGGILAGLVIALIIILTKGMGWGDFEICIMSGLYLGFSKSIVMLMVSFILGGIIGILLIISKKKTKKDYIPFGPYIVLGSIISILFADKIILWYLGFIH